MKKIFILVLSLFSSSLVFANQTTAMCPATLTCNYDAGTCELPAGKWEINDENAYTPILPAGKPINLSGIEAQKKLGTSQEYKFTCFYTYERVDKDSSWRPYDPSISISTDVKNISGDNWKTHGFGKRLAYCNSEDPDNWTINPAKCFGEN